MKPIKLCIFDIDGTLLAKGSDVIEPSALNAIHALHQKGIRIAVATGRNHPFIKPMVRDEVHADFFVTVNGHCVLDRSTRLMHQTPLPFEALSALVEFALKRQVPMAIKSTYSMHVLHDYPTFYTHYSEGFDVKHLIQDNSADPYQAIQSHVPLGVFMMASDAIVDQMRARFDAFQFVRVDQDRLDVFSKAINKTEGIEVILTHLNLNWDDVMAFGDGINDIEMLEKAGVAVVMGNAHDRVKAYADYVTAAVDEGGIAKALHHYHLI